MTFKRKRFTPGRGVHKPGQMNATEKAFLNSFILPRFAVGEIIFYSFELLKISLGPRTFYTIDFIIQNSDGTIEGIEIKGRKGGWEDDARVKFKVAAERVPFRLRAFYKATQKEGGHFIEEYPCGESYYSD